MRYNANAPFFIASVINCPDKSTFKLSLSYYRCVNYILEQQLSRKSFPQTGAKTKSTNIQCINTSHIAIV